MSPKNCWTMTCHMECTSIHIFLCSFWASLLKSSISLFKALYIHGKEYACSQLAVQYSYLLFCNWGVMAKLEFSILHRQCRGTRCQMIDIFFWALETLQRFSLRKLFFFPAKRTLHYELMIKKLKPNVLRGFLSTQTVHTKPAIFSADFSKVQYLSEKEEWSNKGCILDISNKRGEQQLWGVYITNFSRLF